uniref:Uncharacterized protein n=1 Tax=Mycena chlorophos TaxID=658473 RepID=A0ABQ0LKT3_MYCCL|nr:predicted protein [Mycena chlorophos]
MEAETRSLRHSLAQAQQLVVARERVIEGAHAQMVIANMHLKKTNEALYEKETRKTNVRAQLFAGRGQALSGDEFYARMKELDEEAAEKARVKQAKRDAKALRKDKKAELERRWKEIKEAHERNVAEWEAKCADLKAANVPKKRWPAKPKRDKKPTAEDLEEESEEEEEEAPEEEDDD